MMNRRQALETLGAGLALGAAAAAGDAAPAPRPRRVLLIVGENFEELEFSAFSGILSWTRVYSFKGTPIEVTVGGFDPVIGGMGSMRIVPDVQVADLGPEQIAAFDAVAIPCSVGGGRGRRTYKGQENLESPAVRRIVRAVHERGGVIATMCCSRASVIKAGLLKEGDPQCGYWIERPAAGETAHAETDCAAPVVVSNRIITTMGPAVSWAAVLVLIELLNGREQARQFVATCPWVFGRRQELVLPVPVHHVPRPAAPKPG